MRRDHDGIGSQVDKLEDAGLDANADGAARSGGVVHGLVAEARGGLAGRRRTCDREARGVDHDDRAGEQLGAAEDREIVEVGDALIAHLLGFALDSREGHNATSSSSSVSDSGSSSLLTGRP